MATQKGNQVTLIDLARRLKLSTAAVGRALSGTPSTIRVSPETCERVRKLAEELNYRPNRAARFLRTKRSGLIGILASPGFSQLVGRHLYYAHLNAKRTGMSPLFCDLPESNEESVKLALNSMLDVSVDAIVLLRDVGPHLSLLTESGVPLSIVGHPLDASAPAYQVPSYSVDKKGGYALLTRHLVDQGCSKIGLIAVKRRSWTTTSAIAGIRQVIAAMRRRNKTVTLDIHCLNPDYDGFMLAEAPQVYGIYGPGYLGMKEMITSGNLPDGVICTNDSLAQGAVRACIEAGVRVPQDIAIAGFDDDPSSSVGALTLTTISQPVEEIHEAAFADIQAVLSGQQASRQSDRFPCKLIVRESTLRKQGTLTSKVSREKRGR